MEFNMYAVLVAALVPMVMGFIWYNPKVMGAGWMRECGLNSEKPKDKNMVLVFGLSFLFALMLAFVMQLLVIHQMHLGSLFANHQSELKDTTQGLGAIVKDIFDKYGSEFRTFKHGAFHGFMSALFIVLPVIATNAMFESKSWKYIWINWGYWAICFMIMGGIISAWK